VSRAAAVLVVDDDRSTQRVLADALRNHGFEVTVERDGEWAVRAFEKKAFDAVLLDLLLPGLHGYEVARRIRELPRGKRTPLILISGVYTSPLHRVEAVEKHGATAFLEKPIDLERLAATLRTALGERWPTPPEPRPPPPDDGDQAEGDQLADDAQRAEVAVVEQQARTVEAGAATLAVSGDFSRRSFAELLAELYRWRATGALLLKRRRVKKLVYFRDGTAELVKSNLLGECLGRLLVREQLISQGECDQSLKAMRARQRMQGTVLVEMGCLSPHNLQHALRLQLADKLYDVFRWEEGSFQFDPRVPPPPEPVALELTCAQLIHEGVRRAYDQARLARVFGGQTGLFVHPSPRPLHALQDAGLGEEEARLLSLVDGHKSVGTLRAVALLPPLDTDRLLFAMACAQMIELRPHPAEGRPAEKPAPVLARAVGPLLPEPTSEEALPRLAGEERAARERLMGALAEARRADHFSVLGVSPTASGAEVKQAYLALAREYHPDRYLTSASAEVRALARQLYERLSTAHDTLVDPEARGRYQLELAHGLPRAEDPELGRIVAAEACFQRGEALMAQREYAQAHQAFTEAVRRSEQEGEFHAWLGLSLFQADPTRVAEAVAALERAVALSPRLDRAYLFLGYLYQATGRPDEAQTQFEKAIRCNPDCAEALHELQLTARTS
jgi:DNA-binding response OmpR family regulator/DnaJ-domain-containing protein 1